MARVRIDAIEAMVAEARMSREIARYKVRESANALSVPLSIPLSDRRQARVVAVERLRADDAIKLTVAVYDDRADVTPEDLNPWIIVNPPMLVDDPSGDIVLDIIEPDPKTGEIIKTGERRLREDPSAAIIDLIRRKLSR